MTLLQKTERMAAEGAGADPAETIDPVDRDAIDRAVRYQAGKLPDGDEAGFVRGISETAVYHARRAANITVAHNVELNRSRGVRYARVLQGAVTCDWCLMLASRGFVYKSEKDAAAGSHRHCDCMVVPGVSGKTSVEGYDPDMLDERWRHPEDHLEETEWKRPGDPRTREQIALETAVSWSRVSSRGYMETMRSAVSEQAERFTRCAREALLHRDRTLMEDLYAINLDTGTFIAVTDSKTPQQVVPSKGMASSVGKWRNAGQRFATLHNHPESMIPSMSDIRSLKVNGAEFGVVACHDGTVYKYSIVGNPTAPCNLEDEGLFDYLETRRRNGRAEHDTLANIEDNWGVRIERFA